MGLGFAAGGGMDVSSIMMLIHAAEELHGGPAAYVEAGISGLDRPITAVCARAPPPPPPLLSPGDRFSSWLQAPSPAASS